MKLTEHWRQRLQELLASTGLTQAAFAARVDLPADYMSRLLYPEGKPGRKNLGMVTMRKITAAFELPPGWFDEPMGAALPAKAGSTPATRDGGSNANQALGINDINGRYKTDNQEPIEWPFTRVTYERITRVRKHFSKYGMPAAMTEIDKHLDVLVTRWENEMSETSKKKSSAA